ncbi:MAG: FKBP-type peptidyl-prolyl cis-trans isomerase [Dehalococcoidia bacterium]
MKRPFLLLGALTMVAIPSFVGCGGDDDDDDVPDLPTSTDTATTSTPGEGTPTPGGPKLENSTATPSGLEYRDEVVGTGASPRLDQQVTVHYTGKLAATGEAFDSSVGKQPLTLALNRFIKGFTEGVSTMKVGGQRTIYIPSALGYGPGGNPPVIPPNADLIFEVELLAVK